MKRMVKIISSLMLLLTAHASFAAPTHLPAHSTWKLNVARSDFGGGPPMADQFTVLVDTDRWFAYREIVVDSGGKVSNFSWSGPHDGSLRPILGVPGARAGFNAVNDTARLESPNSSLHVRIELSPDGRTRTEHAIVRLKNGKVYHETWIYDRVK